MVVSFSTIKVVNGDIVDSLVLWDKGFRLEVEGGGWLEGLLVWIQLILVFFLVKLFNLFVRRLELIELLITVILAVKITSLSLRSSHTHVSVSTRVLWEELVLVGHESRSILRVERLTIEQLWMGGVLLGWVQSIVVLRMSTILAFERRCLWEHVATKRLANDVSGILWLGKLLRGICNLLRLKHLLSFHELLELFLINHDHLFLRCA